MWPSNEVCSMLWTCSRTPHGLGSIVFWSLANFYKVFKILKFGEFCKWSKLNTRGYLCTLGVPTQSVLQKGYPLAQAHCTAFAQTSSLFVWLTTAPYPAAAAACASPRRCADCLGSTA